MQVTAQAPLERSRYLQVNKLKLVISWTNRFQAGFHYCVSCVTAYSPDTSLYDLTPEELLSRMKSMPIKVSIQDWLWGYRMEAIQASC